MVRFNVLIKVFLLVGCIVTFALGFNDRAIRANPVSEINLPVHYYFSELQRSVNHYFQVDEKGILCEDNSFTNNDNDNFKSICKQIDDITISTEDGNVITKVKVKIQAQYQIVKDVNIDLWLFEFNHTFKLARDLEFDIFITFVTKVKLSSDLNLKIKTSWEYDWLSLPFLSFGPISFRVLDEAAPKVAAVIEDYARNKIDRIILEEVNVPRMLNQTWTNFYKPVLVYSNQNLWDYVYLDRIVSGGFNIDEEKITFPFKINFKNYMGFGSNFIKYDSRLLNNPVPETFSYSLLNLTNNRFNIRLPLKISVSDMERLIFNEISRSNLVVGSGNTAMQVTEVYLTSRNQFVIADVYLRSTTQGSLLGSLVLQITFNPFFDKRNKKLKVRYLKYKIVRSESLLIDIANALNAEGFSRQLEDGIVLELSGYVESIHNLLREQLAVFQYNEILKFKINLEQLEIINISKSDQNLYVFVELGGEIDLELVNLF